MDILSYMRYGILALVNLVFTAFAMVVSPLMSLFANDNGYLPNCLIWFQTQDNSLDEGWRGTYFGSPVTPAPTGFRLWWYRTKWLWRNPAYGFCYYPLGIDIHPQDWIIDTYNIDSSGNRTLLKAHTADGHFCYTNNKGWKIGWKIWSNFQGLDEDGKPKWSDKPWGPELRTSLCFSVPNPFKKH